MEKAIICLIKGENILDNLMKELEMKEYCNLNEYSVVQIIEEDSLNIDTILEFVKITNIDSVVFYEFKEATNNLLELKKLINGLNNLGASAVFIKEGIDTNSIIGDIINRLIDSLLQFK